MQLRHIEVFQAIMKTGTTRAAAQLLNVSQPNITKVLAHAEQRLGFPLFQRIKGRLQPTEEALTLLPEVERVYKELGKLNHLSLRLAQGYHGHIKLAATPTLGMALIPNTLAEFHQQHPDVTVEIMTLHCDTMMQQLLRSELDIGFAFSPMTPPGITCQPLYNGELFLLLPATDAMHALPETITTSSLEQLPFPHIALSAKDPLGEQINAHLNQYDIHLQSVIEIQTYTMAIPLVKQHVGFAIVDAFTALQADEELVVRPLTPSIPFSVSILHNELRPLPTLARQFAQCFHNNIEEVITSSYREPTYWN